MNILGITVVYENSLYSVISNPFEDTYYVVNKRTLIKEAQEDAEPTANFRADALEAVTYKHKERLVAKDAAI